MSYTARENHFRQMISKCNTSSEILTFYIVQFPYVLKAAIPKHVCTVKYLHQKSNILRNKKTGNIERFQEEIVKTFCGRGIVCRTQLYVQILFWQH